MTDEDFFDDEPWRFFCVVFTRDQVSILDRAPLGLQTINTLKQAMHEYNAQLWGYVILPDCVQFVVEVETESRYHDLVESFKTNCENKLIQLILAGHEDLRDKITFFNPAWTKPVYHVWQAGYQTQQLGSAYALSNKVADIVQKPVELGLVKRLEDWPFSSYVPEDNL